MGRVRVPEEPGPLDQVPEFVEGEGRRLQPGRVGAQRLGRAGGRGISLGSSPGTADAPPRRRRRASKTAWQASTQASPSSLSLKADGLGALVPGAAAAAAALRRGPRAAQTRVYASRTRTEGAGASGCCWLAAAAAAWAG